MKLKSLLLTPPLLLALAPAAAAAPKARVQDSISCTVTFTDEETDSCYYVNIVADCTSSGGNACSLTISACDDGHGGVDFAVVVGCTQTQA